MACAAEHDPLTAVVRHANVSDIEMVMVWGSILKQDGRLVAVDASRVQEKESKGSKHFNEGMDHGKTSWARVKQELVRSQTGIQERIGGVNTELAKKKVLEMWADKDAESVLIWPPISSSDFSTLCISLPRFQSP